ncbi:MAG: hypothetical protein PUC65_04175, partial [Clostridiales bacterium]|nr:hypothetical protein [Clostridiales bacterium]
KTGFKALIQFSKENARQVALNTNENTEKVLNELSDTVHRLSEELPKLMLDNVTNVQNDFDSLTESYLENTSLISQRLEDIQKLTEKVNSLLHEQ